MKAKNQNNEQAGSKEPGKLIAGEMQNDISDGNGYRWPICVLTKKQRERSAPGINYVQNPAYCNSKAIAKVLVHRWNCHNELLRACNLVLEVYGQDACECTEQHKKEGVPCPFCMIRNAIAKAEGR